MEQNNIVELKSKNKCNKKFSAVDLLALSSLVLLLLSCLYSYFFGVFEVDFFNLLNMGTALGMSISDIFNEQIIPAIILLAMAVVLMSLAILIHFNRNIPFNKGLRAISIIVWVIFFFWLK